MLAPLNLVAIDRYRNRTDSNELRLEKRILPPGLSKKIQFYPNHHVLRHGFTYTPKYKSQQYSTISICFLIPKRNKNSYIFFRFMPEFVKLTRSDERSDIPQSLLLIDKRVEKQFNLIITYNISAYNLSQRIKPIIVFIQESTRRTLYWVNHNFKKYLEKEIVINRETLNSSIIKKCLKQVMRKEFKNILQNEDAIKELEKALSGDSYGEYIHFSLKNFLQALAVYIIDNINLQINPTEEIDSIALDTVTCIQIMGKLAIFILCPHILRSHKCYCDFEKTFKINTKLPFALLYHFYNNMSQQISAELDIFRDVITYDYYESYRRAALYSIMKRLGDLNPPLEPQKKKIFAFLEGAKNLSELDITTQNARDVLIAIKLIDAGIQNYSIVYNRSSYPIRQQILQMCSPEVTTCEVYTNSPQPENYTNFDYLTNPKNWVDERVAKRAKLIIDYNILACSLSQRIKPCIIATRGNTGVGKSFLVSQFVREYLEENLQLNQGLKPLYPKGVLNPDIIKAGLKTIVDKNLLNSQVYVEGRMMFESFLETLTKHVNGIMGTIIDTRLLTIEEFGQVLAIARTRNVDLELVDVDAPIWSSILSVLSREPFGQDPCVSFEVIKDGFIRARTYRQEFIDASRKENVNYSLYGATRRGRFKLIAQHRNGQFIHNKNLEKYLKAPSRAKLDAIGFDRITEKLINSISFEKKDVLEQWKGYTVQIALFTHSQGIKPGTKNAVKLVETFIEKT